MAKKIKTDDIFDGDLFGKQIQSAKDYSLVLKEIISAQKDLLQVTKTQLKENPISSAKDVQSLNEQTKSIEKTTSSIKSLEKAEKELQKARLDEIKIQQQRESAFDKFNKQQEKNFELQKKQNSVYVQSVGRLRELKAQLKELEITGRTNGKLYKALGAEFVALNGKVRDAEEGVGEFFRNVGNYPQQLRELQKELKNLQPGTEEFIKKAAEAGKIKDAINDAKEATKAFASESKLQTAKTLFSQIGNDLRDLDFVGAADKARQFASVVKSITFAEVLSGIKNFVTALGSVGKALLLNPLTAIVVAVGSVVAAFVKYNEILERNNEAVKKNTEFINEQKNAIAGLQAETDNFIKQQLLAEGNINDNGLKLLNAREKLGEEFKKINREQLDNVVSLSENFDLSARQIKELSPQIQKLTGLSAKAVEKIAELAPNKIFNTVSLSTKANALFLTELEKSASVFGLKRKAQEENFLQLQKAIYAEDVANNKDSANKKEKNNKDSLKKQEYDLTSFYDELRRLRAENNEDDLQRNLELVNLDSEIQKRRIKNEVTNEKLKNDLLIELEIKRRGEIDKLFTIDSNQSDFDSAVKASEEESDAKARIDLLDYQKRKAQRDRDKKEITNFLNQITDRTIQEINKRKQAEINAKEEEINSRKDSVSRQQDLAAKGLTNTLAFEKRELAKSEQEKQRLAKEQEKREKRQVFLKALIANLESAKDQSEVASAFAKSVAIAALADTFAGAFKDGVEDLNGKGTATSDSNLALLSKGESVVTAKGTKKYSGLATAMNSGNAEKWFMENLQPNVVHNEFDSFVLGKKLDAINKTLQSQEKINIHWDSHDARVEQIVKDGYKKTIKHVRSKPKI